MKKVLLLLSFFLCVFANSAEAINEVNETLTHYNVADSKLLSIDDVTISIFREIGWDTERQALVTISCADTISDGVVSAYIPNHFSLCRNGNSVQVQTWQLLLKHNDGSFVNYYSQIGGDTFTISPVANNSSAYVNIDGYMEGEIVLKYSHNDIEDSVKYKVYFDLQPVILDVTDREFHYRDEPTSIYDYSFNVKYLGADYVTIGIEQEHSHIYRILKLNEPYLAHAYIQSLNLGNYVWIDISVSNSYGTQTITIEIPVQQVNAIGVLNTEEDCSVRSHHIDVYTLDGVKLRQIDNVSSLASFSKGCYVLKYKDEFNRIIKTRKISL